MCIMRFADEPAKKDLVGKKRETKAGIEPLRDRTVESVVLITRWGGDILVRIKIARSPDPREQSHEICG